jgi:SAM-dependent methyltransferase
MTPGKWKFYDYKSQVKRWIKFYEIIGDKTKKVLDYGTGPGWAIFVGVNMGFDIVGVDVNHGFEKLRRCLGTDKYTTIFKDKTIYPDKTFDIIICKAVLDKKYNHHVNNCVELERLLKDDGIILVAPESDIQFLKPIKAKNKGYLNYNKKTFDEDLYNRLASIARYSLRSKPWGNTIKTVLDELQYA